jgi:hypothetical protein
MHDNYTEFCMPSSRTAMPPGQVVLLLQRTGRIGGAEGSKHLAKLPVVCNA